MQQAGVNISLCAGLSGTALQLHVYQMPAITNKMES
jgi:hypothetical protein